MEQHGRRIGIMGGTFDPVHIGHLMLAEHAREQYELELVYVMPNGTPAYKSDHTVTDATVRMEMTSLAIENNPGFELSAVEVERAGNTYTYQTLEYLREENPETQYFFIIGADSLFHFETWKEPQIIADNCVLLLANRNRTAREELDAQIQLLHRRYGADIRHLDCPDIAISSEMIRARVRQGKSIRYYVPDAVADYIAQHDLYYTHMEAIRNGDDSDA